MMDKSTLSTYPTSPNFDLSSTPLTRRWFIAMMALLMALNALAIDIMLPAFPAIAAGYTGAKVGDVSLVLTFYLVGFGIAQLFFGTLSDSFGRRKPLFIGMALYMIFAIAGAFAPSFEWLLVARFCQGIGAASTRVISLAIVRDTHSGRAMASTMSLVMMVFMAVPVFAPMIGQVIIMVADWQWIFLFMSVLCAVALAWAFYKLPETLVPSQRSPLTMAAISKSFVFVFSNRTSAFYVFANAFFLQQLVWLFEYGATDLC